MDQWLVMLIIVVLIEHISSQALSSESDEYPLTKSLGYSIKRNLRDKSDDSLDREFRLKYQEMRKASQESYENFEKKEEKRHRRVSGVDELDLVKEVSFQDRRHSANKLQSAVGRRRARSQVLRRNKLNSQSLKSHMLHSKMTNLEYSND